MALKATGSQEESKISFFLFFYIFFIFRAGNGSDQTVVRCSRLKGEGQEVVKLKGAINVQSEP